MGPDLCPTLPYVYKFSYFFKTIILIFHCRIPPEMFVVSLKEACCLTGWCPCRCASCLGESARAQWFRHSDGWRSGSSTLGSAASSAGPSTGGGHKRSPWDSLPSLRQEGSLGDSGYKSNRADSFEQRYVPFIPMTGTRYPIPLPTFLSSRICFGELDERGTSFADN